MKNASIFDFEDTKEYLRAYLQALPRQGWGEVQRWADHLGVQGSFVSQVLSGKKTLNVDQGIRLADLLGLQNIEIDYFVTMIEQEKAGHHHAKKYFAEKLKTYKKDAKQLVKRVKQDKILSEEEKSIFYSSWVYSAARLFCSFPKGKTLPEICQRFEWTPLEAAEIMNFLCASGLCHKEGVIYTIGHQKTHLEKKSPHIRQHWINWHLKAIEQFDPTADEQLVYSAPFSISSKDFELIREELVQFIQGLSVKVGKTTPEDIAVLNLNLVKLK